MQREKCQAAYTGDNLLTIPAVETHLLRSRNVQQTFKVQVMQPARRKGDNRRYPVVYVTDGNWVFDMFKSLSYLLQMTEQDAPPFILVGIGYPSESPFAGMLLRVRDYTFPPYPKFDMKAMPDWVSNSLGLNFYAGTLLPEKGGKDIYGAEDFRRFFSEELVPFIDEKYDTIRGDRTYFGHSGGGFFGLFALFTEPSLFKNYIVSSPGLLFDGKVPGGANYHNLDCGIQMARAFIASGKSADGVRLYMSAGADEEFEPALGPWKMVSGYYQVARVLKDAALPGFELMTEVFPGETHITVWPIAFIHGVQTMLGTRRVCRSVYF